MNINSINIYMWLFIHISIYESPYIILLVLYVIYDISVICIWYA